MKDNIKTLFNHGLILHKISLRGLGVKMIAKMPLKT